MLHKEDKIKVLSNSYISVAGDLPVNTVAISDIDGGDLHGDDVVLDAAAAAEAEAADDDDYDDADDVVEVLLRFSIFLKHKLHCMLMTCCRELN